MAFPTLQLATVLIASIASVCRVDGVPLRREFGDKTVTNNGYRDQVVLPPSEYSNWHNETRQRDKLNRIAAIKRHVLRTLGEMNKPPSGPNFMNNPMNAFSGESGSAAAVMSRSSAFSGKIQTYTAECNSPALVDPDTWTQPGPFHVFFNISSINAEVTNETVGQEQVKVPTTPVTPSRRGRSQLPVQIPEPVAAPKKTVNIISAKLRLYKIGQDEVNQEVEAAKPSEPCNDTLALTQTGQARQTVVQPSRRSISNTGLVEVATSEKIFVRVFYNVLSAGKLHYRKKLLESKTLTVKESGWIDFDIQNAVKVWMGEKTNYGLVIEVENEDNEMVDVSRYFANMECPNANSTNQTSRSTTGQISRVAQPIYPSPILEICSLSLPAPTENGGVQSYTLPYPMSSFLRSPRNTEKSEEVVVQNESAQPSHNHHRRRHHHGEWRRQNVQVQDTPDFQTSMQADSPAVEQTTRFTLAENHPLRLILGTAATGPFTNSGRGLRGFIRNHRKSFKQDLGIEESEESSEGVRNIIIENIVIQPEDLVGSS